MNRLQEAQDNSKSQLWDGTKWLWGWTCEVPSRLWESCVGMGEERERKRVRTCEIVETDE